MKNLSHNLKTLMTKHGVTSLALSRQTGIAQPVIHRIASGDTYNPKIASLIPLADFFDVTLDTLIGVATSPQRRILPQVPLITYSESQNWPAQEAHQPPSQTILTNAPIGSDAFAIRLTNNTMSPRFPEGTVIIIDPDTPPSNHSFVLAQRPEANLPEFKQLLIDGERQFLKPLNPDFSIVAWAPDARIIGTMIEAQTQA